MTIPLNTRYSPSIKSGDKISGLAEKVRILSKSEFEWLTVYDFLRLATMYNKKITRQKIASRQCVRTARFNWKK